MTALLLAVVVFAAVPRSEQGLTAAQAAEDGMGEAPGSEKEKRPGQAEFVMKEKIYVGEAFAYKAKTETNGDMTLYFKAREAGDDTYTKDMPVEPGEYLAKAVFAETKDYKEVSVISPFTLVRMAPKKAMYTVTGEEGKNGWYTSDVVIAGTKGYQVSFSEDQTFTDRITLEGTKQRVTFYVRTATGAVTSEVNLGECRIDKSPPECGTEEGIYAANSYWSNMGGGFGPAAGVQSPHSGSISARDDGSGIAGISYYISGEVLDEGQLKELKGWTEGTRFSVTGEVGSRHIVYARIENEAGLITYLSSGTMVIEPEGKKGPATIQGSGKRALERGAAYRLAAGGNFKVAGDSTSYTGGVTFYISENGTYEFIRE